jgi:hypothetical protein
VSLNSSSCLVLNTASHIRSALPQVRGSLFVSLNSSSCLVLNTAGHIRTTRGFIVDATTSELAALPPQPPR